MWVGNPERSTSPARMTLCQCSVPNITPFAPPSSVPNNNGERCIRLEARTPLKNITNLPMVNSTTPSEVKQVQNNYVVEPRDVSMMNPIHRKRFRDRNRYLQMTPDQREAYLRRNREYKRAKRENYASSSSTQYITGQRNMSCSDRIHKLMESSQVAEGCCMGRSVVDQQGCSSKMNQVATFGSFELSKSGKDKSELDQRLVLPSNMCHLDHGTRLTVSPSGVYACSISHDDQAADNALINSSRRKRQRGTKWYSNLAPEQKEAYLQRNRDYKKRRNFHADDTNDHASCNRQNVTGQSDSLLHQYMPMEFQEHIDHESEDRIYMPTDFFPAIQDNNGETEDDIIGEQGQNQYILEGDGEDCDSCLFGEGGFEYESYQEPDHAICATQVDPYDYIYQNLPSGHHVLEAVPNCRHCTAKRFQYEKPTFCCMGGKVKIVTPLVPEEMHRLYTSQDPEARKSAKLYNFSVCGFKRRSYCKSPRIGGISPCVSCLPK